MQKNKWIYWISTVLISLMMLASGVAYFLSAEIGKAMQHIGFPDHFRVELGFAKIIGALALLVPQVSRRLKEWAYFGFGLTFLSAFFTHYVVGDGMGEMLAPLVALLILSVSYVFWNRLQAQQTAVSTAG
jgi:DoxX-like family